MIGISDDTATDHLIAVVGREAVEAALSATGHHDPGLNRPLLTTRELFQLKLGDPDRIGRYRRADETERRRILDELSTEPLPELAASSFTEPNAIDVEWLAITGDLCRVITWLDARSDDQPELVEALTAGRGPIDRRAWPVVAFKGGSEPGVLSLTWLAADPDGRKVVVAGIANDPDSTIDVDRATASPNV
ncbi:MAG: class A beta-lactamase-related serine hydrolase, partial [Acidimicrobiia bacterium]|nr:class A beta-lactamase-related serine hydrolase [Acidimicrobiia bacterium]